MSRGDKSLWMDGLVVPAMADHEDSSRPLTLLTSILL